MAKNKQKSRNPQVIASPPTKGNSTPITKNTSFVSQTTLNAEIPFFQNANVIMAILAIAVLVAFIGGFSNNFVYWDDPAYVSENKMVQTPTFVNLIRIIGVECALNYHPLTMATLWLNAFLFGKGATSFIATNTLIHVLNTLLVFKFVQKLTNKGRATNNNFIAFFTALLWGV